MNASITTIRRGTKADAAALAAFAERTFVETFGPDNRPEDMQVHLAATYGVEKQAQELADTSTITLLAFDGETLVAYAQIRREPPPECVAHEGALQIHRFYVDRSAHGRGIAQRLMASVHEAARDVGAKQLWLTVWEHNPRAMAFYRKADFVDVGSTDFFVGPDRQTDRVFVCDVQPAAIR